MIKQGKLRTYPIKSLTIFVAICFVISVAMIVLFALPFMANELWVVRILVWVMCGIFAVASGIILIYQLFFYIEIKNGCFYKHFPFGYKKIELKKIEKILNKDGFYTILYKGKKFASFASNTSESQQIIVYLERSGVKIDW